MQVRCRNRISGDGEQQPPYRDPDLDPRGVRSSVLRTVTHLPFHVIMSDFWNVHHSGALLRLNRVLTLEEDGTTQEEAFRGQSRVVASPQSRRRGTADGFLSPRLCSTRSPSLICRDSVEHPDLRSIFLEGFPG